MMENARALDERLRKIIAEISDNTGREIKRNLLEELARVMEENQSREMRQFLVSLQRALKRL